MTITTTETTDRITASLGAQVVVWAERQADGRWDAHTLEGQIGEGMSAADARALVLEVAEDCLSLLDEEVEL